MELISRRNCTAIVYRCFSDGFHEQNEPDSRNDCTRVEIGGWNLEFFRHYSKDELVIWFWDEEGDEDYFGEFWLIFNPKKRAVAEKSFQRIGEFMLGSVERIGQVPPALLEEQLDAIISDICDKVSAAHA